MNKISQFIFLVVVSELVDAEVELGRGMGH
jgi:hypothetical protein